MKYPLSRFVGHTALRGSTVDIAGSSATIDPGSRVRLSNPNGTTVYSYSYNFNNGGKNGNFTELKKSEVDGRPVNVDKQPFSQQPGF
ncbi:MAG: hypothetical protein WEB53_00115 [Akkermansiaceae bacterium]